MSKERNSKLDPFTEQLDAWLTPKTEGGRGMILEAAVAELDKLGCSVSRSRLGEWWDARRKEKRESLLLQQVMNGNAFAKQVDEAFGQNPAPHFQLLMSLIKTLIFKLSAQANLDDSKFKIVTSLISQVIEGERLMQKKEEIAIAQRKLALLEESHAKAKAELQKLRDPKAQLGDDDRKAIVDKVDEILGLK